MMEYSRKIIDDIEIHSVEGIRECFEHGVSPNDLFRGKPLIYELTSEYLRSPRFKECVKLFVDHGLIFEDDVLLDVLMDNATSLEAKILGHPEIVHKRFSLKSAFTPLQEVTLLHICAEHNHVSCAKVLIAQGADVDAMAGIDEYGFGGQTPIFHTVNQIQNHSAEMMDLLIQRQARLDIPLKGLIWGMGYPWETFIPAVNPISYAMMGLLPQMHRSEAVISEVVSMLIKQAYGISYKPGNIPNRYLNDSNGH